MRGRSRFVGLGLLAVIATLTACAGGGGASAPRTTPVVPAPSAGPSNAGGTGPGTTSAATGTASFTIRIPAKSSTAASNRRSPAYVSPATGSVTFTVAAQTTVVPLTLGSASCPLSGGFYTCTAQSDVPAGSNETITVATYASANGTGTPLSTNTVTKTIVAGTNTSVGVILNGVVNKLSVQYSATSVTVGTGASITATLVAYDAAQDQIVGPGVLVDSAGNPITASLAASGPDAANFTVGPESGAGSTAISWSITYNGSGPAGSAIFTASATTTTPTTYTFTAGSPETITVGGGPSPSPSPSASPSASPSPSPSPSHTPVASPSAPTLTGPTSYNGQGWGPGSVANAFSFPVQSGYNGAGNTIAIIIDTAPATSDLNAYFTYFQTPATSRTITSEVIDGSVGTSDAFEATLDTETIGGLAPGSNIIIYEVPELSQLDINDANNQIITDGVAKVVSMSFGGCENAYSQQDQAPIFATGVGDGITYLASSGDQGNGCSSGTLQGVNYPASDPNVTGVGGNESDTSITNPVAWNETGDEGMGIQNATGGGVSSLFTVPSYQSGVSGAASTTYRNVPDVALPAIGVDVYLNGVWEEGLGTSWSAPQMAALVAELDQYCGTPLGNINPALYAAPSSDYIDVTSGNNQYGSLTPYFTAGAGYDNTTGLGMPKGMSLAASFCGTVTAGHAMQPARTHVATRGAAEAVTVSHPTDRAFSLDARPAVLRSSTDLGERSRSASTPIQIVLAPSAARMGGDANVAAILRESGLTVTKTFSNHLIVDAQGTPSQIERLFSTSIHDYAQPQHGTRYAPSGTATVPASLAPFVSGVVLSDAITTEVPQHNGRRITGGRRF
jgi:hypothetical protein